MTEFETLVLARLSAIESRLAAIHATDCERRLFPLIAINTQGAAFTTADLYRHAQLFPELHGALLETCGPTEGPRRLGKLLERWQNKAVAGVEIERIKTVRGVGYIYAQSSAPVGN